MKTYCKIFGVERNIHGAWVIHGSEGVKQYYYFTKDEAIREYKKSAKTIINS